MTRCGERKNKGKAVRRVNNKRYLEDVSKSAKPELNEKLSNKYLLITGATGMLGTAVIDILMFMNKNWNARITVTAIGRSEKKAKERFEAYWNDAYFHFVEHDINQPIIEVMSDKPKPDYIIHAASTTHPLAYANEPVKTITTNLLGAYHLLEFAAAASQIERFVFISSVEVYGENRGDQEQFSEDYCGYIDCNTLRAGYPESKRVTEALCQAYRKQYGINIVIPRLSRVYGPTMLQSDSKAIAQMIKKAVNGEDIVLKSDGSQLYSYTYVMDAAIGVLYTLAKGVEGQVYNISDPGSDISLKEIAKLLSEFAGVHVIYQIPDEIEKSGYSKAVKALLNSEKVGRLGWKPCTHIREGLIKTIKILQDHKCE